MNSMNIEIRKYDSSCDYEALMTLIKSEGDEWKAYQSPIFREVLKNSITYVALVENELAGFSRSLSDFGIYFWVIDLLVHENLRGHKIGKMLIDYICINFPTKDVYIMSDADPYYEKLGYDKEGSIYIVKHD